MLNNEKIELIFTFIDIKDIKYIRDIKFFKILKC